MIIYNTTSTLHSRGCHESTSICLRQEWKLRSTGATLGILNCFVQVTDLNQEETVLNLIAAPPQALHSNICTSC